MGMNKILVVEDEKIVVIDLTKRLLGLGYDVVATCSTGEEAIAKAAELKPDIVLMDIILKGDMDGIEAAGIINQKFDIPIVFLTASTDEMTFQKAKLVAPYGYILKPFEIRDLKNVLENAQYKALTEKKIKEQQKILTATINNITNGVITTDTEGKIILINQKALEILKLELEQCLYKNIEYVYNTSDEIPLEMAICGLSLRADQKTSDLLNYKMLISADGNEVPIEENITFIKNNFNEEIYKVIAFRDLRWQIDLQKKALLSHNYYLRLLEGFPVMVWRTNENGEFNYFNTSWLDFRGKRIEEEIIHRWIDGIYPDERKFFINSFNNALINKSKFEIEFRLLNKDNEYRYIYCYSSPYFTDDEVFEGMIGACFDITNRKIAEEKLTEAKNKLEIAYKTKSDFLSNVTHEIRTPINHIIGFLELLKTTKLTAEQRSFVEQSINSTLSILRMFNSILDYSKIEAGKINIVKSYFNLDRFLKDLYNEHFATAKNKDLEFSYTIAPDVPKDIEMDRLKLHQILNNLVSNAIKFTLKGSVKINVFLEENTNKKYIVFSVKDTGIGIPEDKINFIFESFTQLDSTLTKRFSGTGLGLAIVKELVKALNGEIIVNSELNSGSEFLVKFQLDKIN